MNFLMPSVEIIIRRDDGRFLTVTNRRRGKFSCPGGKVESEDGENIFDLDALENAARRELKEETGLDAISLTRLIKIDNPVEGWSCTSYSAEVGDQEPKNVEDGTDIGWHTAEELLQDSLYPGYYRKLFSHLGIH